MADMVIVNGRRIRREDVDRLAPGEAGKAVAAAGYEPRPLTTRAYVATVQEGPAEAVPPGEADEVNAVTPVPAQDDEDLIGEETDGADSAPAGKRGGSGDADGASGGRRSTRPRAAKGQ